jgi:hypothetical protein
LPTVPPLAPPTAGPAAAPTTVLPPVTVPLPTTTTVPGSTTTAPKSPIDTLLNLLGEGGAGGRAAIVTPSPSTAERASSAITSIGRLFGRAARSLLGVVR